MTAKLFESALGITPPPTLTLTLTLLRCKTWDVDVGRDFP